MELHWLLLLITLSQCKDIYRTYERVEHIYEYPEPEEEEDKEDKEKNELEEYWNSIYNGELESSYGRADISKQEKQTSDSKQDTTFHNNIVTPTSFYDPNVPMCYNCYYSNTSGKVEQTHGCNGEPFGKDVMTVPCPKGLCSVTHTKFEDGGEMMTRGCMEDCERYNTTLMTVQCCRKDRCNGPNIAQYQEQTSAGIRAYSSMSFLCYTLYIFFSVT